jgi:ArsR family transcriptional regulator, arsenate/arsenite/antimonite-responsive transcriptional repressor
MGLSKSDQFTEEQNHLAAMAKALAHPARIAILQYLMKKGTCVCGDIVDELPLSQSTISQHLKELKNAGIIQGNIEGTFTCYCLDKGCCSVLRGSFLKLFDGLKKCC